MYLRRHSHCDDADAHRRSFEKCAPTPLPKAAIVNSLENPLIENMMLLFPPVQTPLDRLKLIDLEMTVKKRITSF